MNTPDSQMKADSEKAELLHAVFDLVMTRPRISIGSSEVTCVAHAATAEERRRRMLDGCDAAESRAATAELELILEQEEVAELRASLQEAYRINTDQIETLARDWHRVRDENYGLKGDLEKLRQSAQRVLNAVARSPLESLPTMRTMRGDLASDS